MNSVAIDIKAMLEADANVCIDSATPAYPIAIGVEPSDPVNVTTIFETNGWADDLTYDATEQYQHPSVQLRMRSSSYVNAMTLMHTIKTSLHGRANETWNGTFYTVITHQSGPAVLDVDKNNRIRLIINFNIQRR